MLKAVEVITADALSDDEAVSVAAFPLTEDLPVLKNLAVWLKRVWAWRVLLKQHGHHGNDPFLINLEHWMKSLQLIRSQYGSRLEDLKLTRFKQGTCKHSQYLNPRVKPYMFLNYNSIFTQHCLAMESILCRAEFILGSIRMYLCFLSFLKVDMAQVRQILPHGGQKWFMLHSQYSRNPL